MCYFVGKLHDLTKNVTNKTYVWLLEPGAHKEKERLTTGITFRKWL